MDTQTLLSLPTLLKYLTLLEKSLKKASHWVLYKNFPLGGKKVWLLQLGKKELPKEDRKLAKEAGAVVADKGTCVQGAPVLFESIKGELTQELLNELGLEGKAIVRFAGKDKVKEEESDDQDDVVSGPSTSGSGGDAPHQDAPPRPTWQTPERPRARPVMERMGNEEVQDLQRRRNELDEVTERMPKSPYFLRLRQELDTCTDVDDARDILDELADIHRRERAKHMELAGLRQECNLALQSVVLGGEVEAKRLFKALGLNKRSLMFPVVDALRGAKFDDVESLKVLERAATAYIEARKNETDKSSLAKLECCRQMQTTARLAQVRAKHLNVRYYTRDDILKFKAEILLAAGRVTRPDEATGSDSFFLRESDNTPRFIFKPQEGEAGEAGFPKGGGAPREILFSHLNDSFSRTLGIDFGICPTVAMRMDHSDFLTDRVTATSNVGAVQQLASLGTDGGHLNLVFGISDWDQTKKDQLLESIPQEEVEKTTLLDLITLNLDRNPGNLLFSSQGGEVHLVPIDAGNALPSLEAYRERADAIFAGVLSKLPQSKQMFSPKMQEKILAMKPGDVRDLLVGGFNAMLQDHPQLGTGTLEGKQVPSIGDDSFLMVERSVLFLKAACTELTQFALLVCYAGRPDAPHAFHNVLMAQQDELQRVVQEVIAAAKLEAVEIEYYTLGADPMLNEITGDISGTPVERLQRLKHVIATARETYEEAGGDDEVRRLDPRPGVDVSGPYHLRLRRLRTLQNR